MATPMATPKTLHPAKFSEPIIARLRVLVQAEKRRVLGRVHDGPLVVLDPFAGVGRIHHLAKRTGLGQIRTIGVEIEEEWAACHRDTIHADAFDWLAENRHVAFDDVGLYRGVDVIATSLTYGNRFSDSHNAQDGSHRRSYTHDLGHKLHPNNSGQMPWGPKYWAHTATAYRLMFQAIRPGGLLLTNVSDFFKDRKLVPVTEWHRGAAMGAGFVHAGRDALVVTDRLQGVGTSATADRAPHETILRLRRPEGT